MAGADALTADLRNCLRGLGVRANLNDQAGAAPAPTVLA